MHVLYYYQHTTLASKLDIKLDKTKISMRLCRLKEVNPNVLSSGIILPSTIDRRMHFRVNCVGKWRFYGCNDTLPTEMRIIPQNAVWCYRGRQPDSCANWFFTIIWGKISAAEFLRAYYTGHETSIGGIWSFMNTVLLLKLY